VCHTTLRYHTYMKRLGELLLEKGAVTVAELHTALEACQRSGGRLGTHLLRFGFVRERELLEALAEQYGVSFVPESLLLKADVAVAEAIPIDMARRLQAIPFDLLQGKLQVAMMNPRDAAALEEIGSHCGRMVEAHVATESAVAKALTRHSGGMFELANDVESEVPKTEWDELWEGARVGSQEMLEIAAETGTTSGRRLQLATYPGLAPLVEASIPPSDTTVDEATFSKMLLETSSRDEVGELLLRHLACFLTRLALFAVHKERIVGWMAKGESVVVDDVQSLSMPLDLPSVFQNLGRGGAYHVGTLPEGEANLAIARCLGEPPPAEVIALPVRVRDRAVAFTVGDVPGRPALSVPIQNLLNAVSKAGVAFEILLLRGKLQS
jgi:hypothetical protein